MDRLNVVLVVLDERKLREALNSLNTQRANLVAVVIESGDGRFLNVGAKKIPLVSFAKISGLLSRGKDFLWLICAYVNNVTDIWQTKKFLMATGVPADNIVNFEVRPHISPAWIGNLRFVEKFGADFFATGISYAEVGLDLNYIPHVRGRGVNLSGSNQDLLQGYLTARHVFAHVKPGTIKFVLIGLTPYSFRYENAKAFAVCSRNLQYMLALDVPPQNQHDRLLTTLVSDNIKNIFANATAERADLNFDRTKNSLHRPLPVKAFVNWGAELKNLTKKLYPDSVEKNFRVLRDYIKLCLDNGAKPVGVVLPFAPIIHDNYDASLLKLFRLGVRQFEEAYDFTCVDLFDLKLGYDCFYNTAHLNRRGAAIASTYLGLQLYEKNIFSAENFCAMSYDYFNALSNSLPKKSYNALLNDTFAKSAELIRRKAKLKVGFVLYDSSMWCGDELYNLFANDDRFEPTIFMCMRTDHNNDELIRKDFLRGVEQFKSRGLNVVALPETNSLAPTQDVLIFLTPYQNVLPAAFKAHNLAARTLLAYIPYAFGISQYDGSNYALFRTGWKMFFNSTVEIELYDRFCKVGMPRGIFSGYPKMDVFFERDADFRFDWKVTRPDAKKIIWAPHWSINDGVYYATFQWNCKFMYEFARAHPEISWVVKPHPNLLYSAVEAGVFPNEAAFNDYLAAWNNLPNAKVVTGGYYQGLFATSDGMIHDSGSFIAEYQFTHKPMIFLTREGEQFNELGNAILNVSYRVDGRDLNGIAALMQKIFVEGNDPMKAARMKFFDEQLNYVRRNGCTASEFIYRAIAGELSA